MNRFLLAGLSGCVALAAAGAVSAQATTDTPVPGPGYRPGGAFQNPNGNTAAPSAPMETVAASRLRTDGEDRERRRRQPQTAPTAADVARQATAMAAVGVPSCSVTETGFIGMREDGSKIFEVACASGPGYIMENRDDAETPPKVSDCVQQWSYGQLARESDPTADVGLQCSLAGNQNPVAVITAYGAEAGVQCQVDQAVATAIDAYEIGCSDRDGWRLERRADAWRVTSCWELGLKTDISCRYSSDEEAEAEWPKLVAGTDAAACRVEDVAWMGDNADRGSFYEVRCASGEGIVVRFKDGAGQQTYSCIDAPQIFRKPCSLTTVAAPAAAPPPTGGRA